MPTGEPASVVAAGDVGVAKSVLPAGVTGPVGEVEEASRPKWWVVGGLVLFGLLGMAGGSVLTSVHTRNPFPCRHGGPGDPGDLGWQYLVQL